MFSWWTTGGEEAGLKALYALYKQDHANVEIVNQAVAGAAGSDAKAVLKTRMQGGDPPDAFQVHMGHELTDGYVAANQVEPLDGTLGADGYKGLWTGQTKWDDANVTDALNTFKKMLGYVNSDHAALTWDQANDQLIQGKAGMTIMGDWTDADYKAKKFTGYGW